MKVKSILKISLLAFFTVLMLRITIPYVAFEDDVAFLKIKHAVIDNAFWKTAFYTHVLFSCFCLLAGFTQFSRKQMVRHPKLHRYLGYLYIGVILLLSGPSGFIMAIFANGGFPSQLAFTLLSILWMSFTWKAFISARSGNFLIHEAFMIRSYALTLSALTLRAWKWMLVLLFRPHPMDVYQWVAWLGWVPNFLFAEWYIAENVLKGKLPKYRISEWFFRNSK